MTEWTDGATCEAISQWSGLMKLRRCDCGTADSGLVDVRGDDSSDYAAWVICRVCGRTGPECVEDTKEQAIAAAIAGWNARPAEDALRALLRQAVPVLRGALFPLDEYTQLMAAINAALEVTS